MRWWPLHENALSLSKPFAGLALGQRCPILSGPRPHPKDPPMKAKPRLDIRAHFAALRDPRDPRFVTHLLGDLLTIALCALLSGARSFEDLATFGRTKQSWLRSLGLA